MGVFGDNMNAAEGGAPFGGCRHHLSPGGKRVTLQAGAQYQWGNPLNPLSPGPQGGPNYAIIYTCYSATGWSRLGIIQVFSLFP